MDKYYYFAAQLPMLNFEKEEFPSSSEFLAEAEKWLSPKDLNILADCKLESLPAKVSNKTLAEFYEREKEIKSEVTLFRKAQKEEFEHKTTLFPISVLKEGTPLEIELKLLKLRWAILEEQEFGHYSDMDFLCTYFLRIQILEKRAVYNKEKGYAKFEKISIYKETV